MSTLGIGIEGIYGLNPFFNLRAQVNGISINHSINNSGNDYRGRLKFLTYGVLADWHPFSGYFRVTVGGYGDSNRIDLSGNCRGGCDIGNYTITTSPSQSGRLSGRVKFAGFAPYAGFGWGNALLGSPIHFAFDIGALYQGTPKVGLNASGTATINRNDGTPPITENVGTDPTVQAEVARQAHKARHDIGAFKFYPVIRFTVGYRFGG